MVVSWEPAVQALEELRGSTEKMRGAPEADAWEDRNHSRGGASRQETLAPLALAYFPNSVVTAMTMAIAARNGSSLTIRQ